MKHVWQVDIHISYKLGERNAVVGALFSNELSAQSYADKYRESAYPYTVVVRRREVHD